MSLRLRATLKTNLGWLFTFCALVVLFSPLSLIVADEIYSWTDSNGRVHFSTTPSKPGAKPADLPQVVKEDLDQRIEQIRDETPDNCLAHGEVDCSRGADSDGSVICFDGYRNALLPFRFHCLAVRLKAKFLLQYDGDQEPELHRKKIPIEDRFKKLKSLHLAVRNLSAAEADGVEASFEIPADTKIRLSAVGPAKVEPFGLADYSVDLGAQAEGLTARQIEMARWRLRCNNCGAILSSKK